ncbi:MAG: fused MFS/spermidine synthase [Akkermansiaceae bacterium]|nr:fused MFS/spermidine synthase [Akkermansiaceae bacterium]
MRRTEVVHTKYQSLEIWKSNVVTEFRVAGATHAAFHQKRFLTGLAWDLIAAAALLRKDGPPRSILMLGLAGGTAYRILQHLLPNCQFTAIDIDHEIIDLARKHMNLDELKIKIHTTDAYSWLAKNQQEFDVVVDDIYLAGKTDVFRPQLLSLELLGNLRRAVSPGGVLAVNLVTGAGHRKMQSATRKILRESFPTVRCLRTPDALNEVLVAGEFIATQRELKHYTEKFTNWRDRVFWERITARGIS